MKLNKKINLFARTHYPLISSDKFKDADFALSNSACHMNAVQAVKAGRADKVWIVWAGGNDGVIHFINSKKGVFFDETWVDSSTRQEYRIIREIKPCEYDDVFNILCDSKRLLVMMLGDFIDKIEFKLNMHKRI